MQATLNAVESFRRARLIDGVTSDDDKPAAVYRLDEICDLLLDSTNDVVREVVDYIAQRLEDRSPYVKQKVGARGPAAPDPRAPPVASHQSAASGPRWWLLMDALRV